MIEIKNLTKVYDDGTVALKNVSFSVGDGEFLDYKPASLVEHLLLAKRERLLVFAQDQIAHDLRHFLDDPAVDLVGVRLVPAEPDLLIELDVSLAEDLIDLWDLIWIIPA